MDCSAEHLFQFAVMGSELVTVLDGIERPKVGLLNIGQEEIKGNEQVKLADALLRDSSLNYMGYVEGDDIYLNEEVDIVVTDGFVGNVALKTSEGVAKMIRGYLKEGFTRNIFTKIAGLCALPILKGLSRRIDPRRYNGASLLGLRGVVVKSHASRIVSSSTSSKAFRHECLFQNRRNGRTSPGKGALEPGPGEDGGHLGPVDPGAHRDHQATHCCRGRDHL